MVVLTLTTVHPRPHNAPVKIGFSTGPWDSDHIRDPRWRKIIEKIDTAGPAHERLQLARKVLRDGNDVTRSMLFEIFLREQMDTRWGDDRNPFAPVLGAMRVQAIHILHGKPGPEGRYHEVAMELLSFAPKPRDIDLLLHHLRGPAVPRSLRAAALAALPRITKGLWPAQIDALLTWAEGAVLDPTLDGNELLNLSVTLADSPDPRAADLLERAILARPTSDAAGWFATALVRRDRARWRPLGEQIAAAMPTNTFARSSLRAELETPDKTPDDDETPDDDSE